MAVYYKTVLIVIVQLERGGDTLITIDYKSRVPIYDQITAGIIRLKTLGVLKNGDKLPSVRSLAVKLGINPNTVQKAYAILESEGVICSVSGKGSFVSEDSKAADAILTAAKDDFKIAVETAKRMGLSEDTLSQILEDVYRRNEK